MYNNIKKEFAQETKASEKISWMRIARSHNIGTKTMLKLLETYRSLDEALSEIKNLAKENGSRITLVSVKEIEKEIAEVKKAGAKIICPLDYEYPRSLMQMHDFPLILTVKGDVACLEMRSIAIVGSRNCSMVSRKFAESISNQLVEQGFCIVSGMATGIDTAAHKGAIHTENGKTIAVLAGGIDNIYPKENYRLYNQIADSGLLVAEDRLGTVTSPHHFPKRNRIITGLSLGVVVVEAAENSGSLTTARFALEQGKDVFVVPGHPTDKRNAGGNSLLKQGAILVESAEDIAEALAFSISSKSLEMNDSNIEYSNDNVHTIHDVHALREKILSLLSVAPIYINDLLKELECDVSLFQQAMTELELAGVINRLEIINQVSLAP